MHVKGTGFSDVGRCDGRRLEAAPAGADGGYGAKMTYDASTYRGVAFWAKARHRSTASRSASRISTPTPRRPRTTCPIPSIRRRLARTASASTRRRSRTTAAPTWFSSARRVTRLRTWRSRVLGVQLDTTWKRFEVLFADTKQDPGNLGYHTADDNA